MKDVTMMKKLFILMVTTVLVIGFNFSIFASAHLDDTYKDEGILIDNFEDSLNIILNRCIRNDTTNTIILDNGTDTFTYNYSGQPDSIKAWSNSLGVEGGLTQFISPSKTPGEEFDKKDMAALNDVDNVRLETVSQMLAEQLDYVFSPIHHFQFKTNQKVDNINNLTIKWWYGDYVDNSEVNLEKISLWVWVYEAIIPHWKQVKSVEYKE